MNILRHKKWHVRTKENVARVRRDEAKAAEEERVRAERAALAEHEDRVRRLKSRATSGAAATVASASDIFGTTTGSDSTTGTTTITTTKHVNLFAELEEQERTNTVVGNREYAAERKKEQDDWESKVGIMKRFAEDTKEYAKESEWWEGIPLVREKVLSSKRPDGDDVKSAAASNNSKLFLTEEERRALRKMKKKELAKETKRQRKEKKKRKKSRKHHRHSSAESTSSSSTDSEEEQRRKSAKLDELRKERIVRERHEQAKVKQLFVKPEPKEEAAAGTTTKSQADEDRKRRYNSQFNPDFARS